MVMIIGVTGSREITVGDKMTILSTLRDIIKSGDEVVVGDATGVDELVSNMYKDRTRVIHADWKKYGKQAGPMRNAAIVEVADIVVAFWDGVSPGTRNCIDIALRRKVPTYITMLVTPMEFSNMSSDDRIMRTTVDLLGDFSVHKNKGKSEKTSEESRI